MPKVTVIKWSFTCGNFNKKRGPVWTTSSPPVYPSKGAALFFAYQECKKHGCPPKAVHVSVHQTTMHEQERGSLAFAL
jgi:hypothetical protein